jgi:PAS domain S-box-containing protein
MQKNTTLTHSIARQFTRHYFIASIIPVILLLVVIATGAIFTRNHMADLITKSTNDLNSDAEQGLQHLGEEIIMAKARDVARQIEMYFRMHPDKTWDEMRKDPQFMQLASQKVGITGYTAITEAHTYLFRVHPNAKLNDTDMRPLATRMPTWWKIVEVAIHGTETAGYYDWREPDNTIRRKYLAVTPVAVKRGGAIIMISATTYIDEFSAPVVQMRQKADTVIGNYQQYVSLQLIIFSSLSAVLILLTFLGTYFWGRRTGLRYIKPITQLAETAKQMGEGKWDIEFPEPVLSRADEIGIMGQSFYRMSLQLKETFGNLEERLAELRQTQDALKASEAHYRSLFDGIPVGLFRTTLDGQFLDANPALVAMLGFPDRQTLLSVRAQSIYFNANDRGVWMSQMNDLGGVHTYEIRLRRYDGSEIWAASSSRTVYNNNGQVLYYEGSLIETTERRLADEALKKSEAGFKALYEESKRTQEVYRSLINSSADAIVTCDLENNITYISPMFTSLFGWSPSELLGKPIPFIPETEKEKTLNAIGQVIEKGIPCQGLETRRTTRDGRLIDVSLSASRYNDHAGRPAGILLILRDISAAKRLEEHLQQVERMEAIATLAGGIAHDFNNLLMVIQGTVSLLLYSTHEVDPHYKHFINIEKQVHRGSRLTKQLLGYARKGKYDVKPLNLNDLIAVSAETLGQTRKDIRIHYRLADDLKAVEADAYQMEQVFMNLFINAADAMSGGGQLTLTTANISATSIPDRLRENQSGDYVLFSIKDTGIGMDAKTMDRIFEPFFTTKEISKGTGLGLASVYGIVKSHGGVIDVASEPGAGTTFSLYLPASDRTVSPRIVRQRKTLEGRGVILLIDDEKPVLEVASAMLTSIGYTTLKANSGLQGIETYREQQSRINLVILDMIMPDMNGGEVFDRLKEINPGVTVLLSSGYSIDGRATDILNRGCKGFIQKPFGMDDLAEKINSILRA